MIWKCDSTSNYNLYEISDSRNEFRISTWLYTGIEILLRQLEIKLYICQFDMKLHFGLRPLNFKFLPENMIFNVRFKSQNWFSWYDWVDRLFIWNFNSSNQLYMLNSK